MGAEESQETRVPAAPPWWLLLLKTHLLCVGLSFPFLPHCSLSNDVRPSPKLISHATEFSSSQAGSLLGDIPSRLLILGNLHPISLCFICFLSIFFLRNTSIQKHLQLREAGSRLFFFNAVCTISYYSHLWTLWCLTLPSFSIQPSPCLICVRGACALLWRRLSKYFISFMNYFFWFLPIP